MKTVSGLQFWSHRFRGLGSNDATIRSRKMLNSVQGTRLRLGYLLLNRDNTNSPRIGSSLGSWPNNRDLFSNQAVNSLLEAAHSET